MAKHTLRPYKREGYWHIRGLVKLDDGGRVKVRKGTGLPETVSEGEVWKIVENIFQETVTNGPATKETIGDIMKTFVSDFRPNKNELNVINQMINKHGNKKSDELTARDFSDWAYEDVRGARHVLRNAYIASKIKLIQKILRRAKKLGSKINEALLDIDRPRVSNIKTSYFEAEERDRFIDEMPGSYRRFTQMLFGAGGRFSETRRLRRRHLTKENNTVLCTFKNRKNSAGEWKERTVPLSQIAVDALPVGWEAMDRDDYLYTYNGEPVDYGCYNYRWNQTKHLLKIDNQELTPHTARHTFATLLLVDKGLDIAYIAFLIGDTVAMCEKRYLHIRPEKAARAMSRVQVLGVHKPILAPPTPTHDIFDTPQTSKVHTTLCISGKKDTDVKGVGYVFGTKKAQNKIVSQGGVELLNDFNRLVRPAGFEPATKMSKEYSRRQKRPTQTNTTQLSDTQTRKKG